VKRVVIEGPYHVEIEDVEIPSLGPKDVLVRTKVSGISSGTEMTIYRGTHPNLRTKKWGYWTDYPIYPGYEVAGIVVKVGKDVQGFSNGDRVVGLGSHGEYAKISVNELAKLSNNVGFEESTLAVLGATTMHAVRRASIEYRDTVTILGAGVVGILAMQHVKLSGAEIVIVIDLNRERLKIADRLGADYTINAGIDNSVKKAWEITGIGSDVVIEATGAPEPVKQSLLLARDRGRVVILGYHTKPIELLLGDDFYHKELEIRATRATGPIPGSPYSYVRWTSDKNLKEAVKLINNNDLKVRKMITHTFKYSEIDKVYEGIDRGSIKGYCQIILNWE
jgi:2-desacetyl-2-hydroxyethyl bacteriochlorophyllide A dehydrogenase